MSGTQEVKPVAVVMAGGSGERFWPVSRRLRPKQLLRLTSGQACMLAETVSRMTPLIPPEDIYVATGRHLVEPIRQARVGLPAANIIAEPCKRNTAGCLTYATAWLLARYGDPALPAGARETQERLAIAVLTADHLIGDADAFRSTVATALEAAMAERALATIGIPPTRPETGYGYIQVPEDRQALPRYAGHVPVYPVTAFHEKPDLETAERFQASGRYFWNSGMFFWNAAVFLDELAQASPALAEATLAMAEALRARDDARADAAFEKLDSISIDYALMERATKVIMARAAFTWDDIGAWTALDRTYPHDDAGNVVAGDPVAVGCRDCIIYHDADTAEGMAVAVVGAENLVVVVTGDAVLVMPKERAQDVRDVVAELKRRQAPQL